MIYFEVIGVSLIALWIISFSYNIYYFIDENDTALDTVFINNTKTFEEANEKLKILEETLGRSLSAPRRKLKFYENNAQKTRRKYKYYSSYIEPALVRIYTGNEGSKFKRGWSRLDKPIKYHFINIYIFLSLLVLLGVVTLFISWGFPAIIFIIFSSLILLRIYNFLIKINFLFFYILLDGILIVLNQNRGKLMKNVALLELMNTGWWGSSSSAYAVTAAGVSTYSGSGGGSFGGFGGGSFGGGGAGGSW